MRRKDLQQGREALDLLEESFHTLRRSSAATLACYYAGALPFIAAFLYFWSDMSRSPLAFERVAIGSGGLMVLFVWMKTCQALFAQRLLAQITGEEPPRWTFSQWLRVGATQSTLQPSGLFLLPLALIPLLPFGWLYAFYQNATVLSDGTRKSLRDLARPAWEQAKLWPKQNHIGLVALKALGLFVFLNWVVAFLAVPFLLEKLLGVETPVSRLSQNVETLLAFVFNTSFLTAIFGLTYLVMDPLAKTFYVLRCFYGESLQTGRDLRVELRLAIAPGMAMAVLVGLFLLSLGTGPALAAPAFAEDQAGIKVEELDRSIQEVIRQPEYSWRLPRDQAVRLDPENEGWLVTFAHGLKEVFQETARTIGRWVQKVIDWITQNQQPKRVQETSGGGWLTALRGLVVVLLVALAALLLVLLYRLWRRNRWDGDEAVTAQPVLPVPDVADENVSADQLPEDGWVKLAKELMERGEYRLALRAYYLAALASLADRELIALAKFKSNRDYEREVARRDHAMPGLLQLFCEIGRVFDRTWYGLHEADAGVVQEFAGTVERIKVGACA